MKEAAWYKRDVQGAVRCLLCPNHCRIPQGKRGICLTRRNVKGMLVSDNYCRPVSIAIDPIEKKPLYHFFPGSSIFSTGPNGCTFKCVFCQNCDISQRLIPVKETTADELFHAVVHSGTIGIAYTYSEPYIWFETIMEVAPKVKTAGLVNVMVTNGFMEESPLEQLLPFIDAMNIDIKAIDPAFYRRQCKGRLEPVLRTCETVKKSCHLEVTNLLIPGLNDSEKEVRSLVQYISTHLGRDTPLHLSRYFPRYKLSLTPTPLETMLAAHAIAQSELQYVYLGNITTPVGCDTCCPSCGKILVKRKGYAVEVLSATRNKNTTHEYISCPLCGTATNIITR